MTFVTVPSAHLVSESFLDYSITTKKNPTFGIFSIFLYVLTDLGN